MKCSSIDDLKEFKDGEVTRLFGRSSKFELFCSPTQLEIKITNSILSEQADRERKKNKIVIFSIPVHPSSATEESARKKEEADEDKRKLDLVFQEMGVD